MVFARRLLVGLAGLLVILVVIGLFLPSSAQVERSVVIEAPPETVYAIVSDFNQFNSWSPWYENDPNADYTISPSGTGVGATFSWASEVPGVGSGSQQIIALEENRLVEIKLDFGPDGQATSSYALESLPDGSTRVTWGFDTDFGYDLIGRYLGLVFDKWIGQDYEKGLAKLRQLVESTTPPPSTRLPGS